jgi:hypothetical protein
MSKVLGLKEFFKKKPHKLTNYHQNKKQQTLLDYKSFMLAPITQESLLTIKDNKPDVGLTLNLYKLNDMYYQERREKFYHKDKKKHNNNITVFAFIKLPTGEIVPKITDFVVKKVPDSSQLIGTKVYVVSITDDFCQNKVVTANNTKVINKLNINIKTPKSPHIKKYKAGDSLRSDIDNKKKTIIKLELKRKEKQGVKKSFFTKLKKISDLQVNTTGVVVKGTKTTFNDSVTLNKNPMVGDVKKSDNNVLGKSVNKNLKLQSNKIDSTTGGGVSIKSKSIKNDIRGNSNTNEIVNRKNTKAKNQNKKVQQPSTNHIKNLKIKTISNSVDLTVSTKSNKKKISIPQKINKLKTHVVLSPKKIVKIQKKLNKNIVKKQKNVNKLKKKFICTLESIKLLKTKYRYIKQQMLTSKIKFYKVIIYLRGRGVRLFNPLNKNCDNKSPIYKKLSLSLYKKKLKKFYDFNKLQWLDIKKRQSRLKRVKI